MKLKSLLAASKSFINIRSDKTPFAVTSEKLVPQFGTGGKFRREKEDNQPVESELPFDNPPDAPKKDESKKETKPQARLGFWEGLKNLFGARQKPARRLVQSELHLGQVKAVRNDLSDADLELVLAGGKDKPGAQPIFTSTHQPERGPIKRLTHRLFEVSGS